jgi:hypothetical protein
MAAPPDNHSPRPNAATARVADFWRWWRGEIVRMLPQRFAAFGGGGSTPLVLVEGDEVIVIDPHAPPGPRSVPTSQGSTTAASALSCARCSKARARRAGRARAALRHHEALVRRVTLPAATEENLAQVLGFEMDRLTPFKSDEVYFDQRVVSRDAADGQIAVELAMAPRDRVDARVRELGSLGVSVQAWRCATMRIARPTHSTCFRRSSAASARARASARCACPSSAWWRSSSSSRLPTPCTASARR